MSECRQPLSGRLPPHVEGPAGKFADRVRTQTEVLDEVSQARMERALLERVRLRPPRGVERRRRHSHVERRRRNRWRARFAYVGLAAAAAAAGAMVVVLVRAPRPVVVADGSAQFELYLPDGAVQRGPVAEGQALESGRNSRIQIAIGRSRVELERRSKMRFDRIGPKAVELTLNEGRVDVAFKPIVRGEQRMVVETRAARVMVVGTRFTVDVDGLGNTRVRVSEGMVDVLPRYGGQAHTVRAGEDLEVMADPGDGGERAVREAIASNLAEMPDPATPARAVAAPVEQEPGIPPVSGNPLYGMLEQESARAAGKLGRPLYLSAVRVRSPVPAPSPLQVLEAARGLLREGQHAVARDQLHKLANDPEVASSHRAEAWTLLAESYTAEGYIQRATEAYRAAVAVAPDNGVGHNALFALARLLERHTDDAMAAVEAYEDYLKRLPHGALASQARSALCRMGGYPEHCD